MTDSLMGSAGGARRPARRIGLAVALVSALALLCCGGGVGSYFLTDDTDAGNDLFSNAFGCGEAGVVDASKRLPSVGTYGETQIRNAAVIVNVGAEMKVPFRGWVIAIATAMQESTLSNLPHLGARNDHDSVGLFQQRPSQGWGSAQQLQDPKYASRKFYEKLLTIDGWQQMALTDAAQRVQVSAYPDAYAKHEPIATQIVNLLTGGAARAAGNSTSARCAASGEVAASGWTVPVRALIVSGFRTAHRPGHDGVDLGAGRHTPIRAAAAGQVITSRCDVDPSGRLCNRDGSPSTPGCGWYVKIRHAGNFVTMYCHMIVRPKVTVGQMVAAGQEIGLVGTSGRSSGPHLHFEVFDSGKGDKVDPVAFMHEKGAPLGGKP
ncbi:M23 family metallopeptidase [Phytohabitans kaempferiae]|uniref:M23 family metallopeptidase n=1 Tax=Phytohabitans kaempferiae TaxID=1620943 RepID=A0ABV6MGK8_9ACTN